MPPGAHCIPPGGLHCLYRGDEGGLGITLIREGIELTPARVVETPEVTHIRYVIGPRAKLELDDRGAGG